MLDEGDKVREYTLKKFLGKGGYGEVWLAEKKIEFADEGIPFALKFLTNQSGMNVEIEAVVKNEVNTWIKAGHHYNIVPVHDGFTHSRFLVIVSEYVEGGSVKNWLKSNNNKAPSLAGAVEMMRGILQGLAHLHSRNIIHRDLKPDNILLKDGIPKITDFGVSRVVETFSPNAAMNYTWGLGTPLYMPPEAFGEGHPLPPLDTWAAGVMCYQMLSGSLPFSATMPFALYNEILQQDPRPLPEDVPEELREFVLKSLVKDPSGRFQTAQQMLETLNKAWAAVLQRQHWLSETIGNESWLEREGQKRTAEQEAEQRRLKLMGEDYFQSR